MVSHICVVMSKVVTWYRIVTRTVIVTVVMEPSHCSKQCRVSYICIVTSKVVTCCRVVTETVSNCSDGAITV